jgi:cytochrome-b5 reductase
LLARARSSPRSLAPPQVRRNRAEASTPDTAWSEDERIVYTRQGFNPAVFSPLKLEVTVPESHDTKLLRFRLAEPKHLLKLPVCSYILVQEKLGEELVTRPYTPLDTRAEGHMDLLVKRYETGKMSKHLHSLKHGDSILVKGPIPSLPYKTNMRNKIVMIAGGTGLTPMLQLVHHITANPNDNTEITLLFANKSEEDILLPGHLTSLQAMNKRLKVVHFVEKPGDNWSGEVGRVTAEKIKKYAPPNSENPLILVCGPKGMLEAISGPKGPNYTQGEVGGALKELGYSQSNVFKF